MGMETVIGPRLALGVIVLGGLAQHHGAAVMQLHRHGLAIVVGSETLLVFVPVAPTGSSVAQP